MESASRLRKSTQLPAHIHLLQHLPTVVRQSYPTIHRSRAIEPTPMVFHQTLDHLILPRISINQTPILTPIMGSPHFKLLHSISQTLILISTTHSSHPKLLRLNSRRHAISSSSHLYQQPLCHQLLFRARMITRSSHPKLLHPNYRRHAISSSHLYR